MTLALFTVRSRDECDWTLSTLATLFSRPLATAVCLLVSISGCWSWSLILVLLIVTVLWKLLVSLLRWCLLCWG